MRCGASLRSFAFLKSTWVGDFPGTFKRSAQGDVTVLTRPAQWYLP
jgi:hypothetical protein